MASSIDINFIEPIYTLKLNLSKIYDPLLDFKLYKEKKEAVEFLELAGGQAEKKYCERTYSQYVYPDVYWVHYVDGVKTKTYISSYQLDSYECDSLTPTVSSTTINGVSIEYISNYVIDSGSNFGEHKLKITYKSPDSGKVLKIKFSIYYLEEIGFDIGDEIVWYPFRNLLSSNFEDLGYGRLKFECIADNGNIIQESWNIARNTSNIGYEFPEVSNADFKFGDNQIVNYTYISSYARKEYIGQCIWNIRPYNDSSNTKLLFVGYPPMKDLEVTEIKIKSDVEYYSEIVYPTEYEDTEDYYSQILQNSTKVKTNNIFEPPYIASVFSDHNVNIYYFWDSYPASTGYIYWGDGTFSYYQPARAYHSSTTSTTSQQAGDVKIINGYKLVNGVKTAQYIQPYNKSRTHVYENSGEYTVIITSAYASQVRKVSSQYVTYSQAFFGSYHYNSYSSWYEDWCTNAYIGGSVVTSYTPYKDLVLPTCAASAQVQEIKIGDACFLGTYRRANISNNQYYTERGFYGTYNYGNMGDGILTPYFANNFVSMHTLSLPKMSATCTPLIKKEFFKDSKSLKTIYYNGTKSDFQSIFGVNCEYIDNTSYYYFKGIGDNATFRSGGETYSFDVICTDGTLSITL